MRREGHHSPWVGSSQILLSSLLGGLHVHSDGEQGPPRQSTIIPFFAHCSHAHKEAFYGKSLILADRDMVELESDEILRNAVDENVAFLVVGDPFGCSRPASFLVSISLLSLCSATTHTDLLLRARDLHIPTQIIHNASIINAAGCSGLQLYNFGQTVSLVFFTDAWKPDSFYDRIAENAKFGLHTLILLDIKVKEQSEENLARYLYPFL
jgi:diphthine synthase